MFYHEISFGIVNVIEEQEIYAYRLDGEVKTLAVYCDADHRMEYHLKDEF